VGRDRALKWLIAWLNKRWRRLVGFGRFLGLGVQPFLDDRPGIETTGVRHRMSGWSKWVDDLVGRVVWRTWLCEFRSSWESSRGMRSGGGVVFGADVLQQLVLSVVLRTAHSRVLRALIRFVLRMSPLVVVSVPDRCEISIAADVPAAVGALVGVDSEVHL
jgi:hypothetical protein